MCYFGVISNTVAKCLHTMFLLQEEMPSPAWAAHSAMAAPGLLLPWLSRGMEVKVRSLLYVCVGKQSLASGEGLRPLLGPRQPRAYSSQAFLEQSVPCSR